MRNAARFGALDGGPTAVSVDSAGNLYVVDTYSNTIRKVTPVGTNLLVTTLAGLAGNYGNSDGTGLDARFYRPGGMAVDSAGNLYVADSGNHTIRKVTLVGTNWVVTTLAGQPGSSGSADGLGSAARFNYPSFMAVDSTGNVPVTDTNYSTIRKVTPTGVVTTLAGNPSVSNHQGRVESCNLDGTGSAARFSRPSGVAVDSMGNVYVADFGHHSIRKVTPSGVVTTLAGHAPCVDADGNLVNGPGSSDGTGSAARFNDPSGVAVDSAGNLYVADSGNNRITKGYPTFAITSSGSNFGFSAGEFGFDLARPPAKPVFVEASSDLINWLPLWTNALTGGAVHFSEPQRGVSRRLYRAQTP